MRSRALMLMMTERHTMVLSSGTQMLSLYFKGRSGSLKGKIMGLRNTVELSDVQLAANYGQGQVSGTTSASLALDPNKYREIRRLFLLS